MSPVPRLLVPLLLALVVLAPAARADVPEVLAGLRESPLYVDPDSTVRPDEQRVRSALEGVRVPTYVAVVPQAEVDDEQLGIDGLSLRLLEGLDDPTAVLVVVTDGEELQAVDGGGAGVDASALLDQVLGSRVDEPFTEDNLTAALVELAELVDARADPDPTAPGSTRRTVGLVGLVAVAVLGGGGWLYLRAQRRVLAEAPLTSEDLRPSAPGWSGVPDGEQGRPTP